MNTLEQRLHRVEAIEAIRVLKARYCDACDDDHNGLAVAELFTENGSWQVEGQPPSIGREAIAAYMDGIRQRGMRSSAHLVSNPLIDVHGDRARAEWRLVMLFTTRGGESFHRIIGRYSDTCVCIGGHWMFESLLVTVDERGPYQASSEL